MATEEQKSQTVPPRTRYWCSRVASVRFIVAAAAVLALTLSLRGQDPVGRWKDDQNRFYTIENRPGGLWLSTPSGMRLSGRLDGRTITAKYAYSSTATDNPSFFQDIPAPVLQQLEQQRDGFRYEGTIKTEGDQIEGRFFAPRFSSTQVLDWSPIPVNLTRYREFRVVIKQGKEYVRVERPLPGEPFYIETGREGRSTVTINVGIEGGPRNPVTLSPLSDEPEILRSDAILLLGTPTSERRVSP